MSVVTNMIVSIEVCHAADEEGYWPKVNSFFPEGCGLVSVRDTKLPSGWYGGTKGLEATIAIGAFNFLDMEGFIAHLRSMEWDEPASVQIIYKGQDETKFSIIDVIDHEWK